MSDPLAEFSIPVRAWFGETFGEPTPPQAEGWPPIQRGEHTLILAPTGSGKTLAAFLWGIDELYRELMPRETHQDSSLSRPDHEGLRAEPPRMTSPRLPEGTSERRAVAAGVRLLYISPLKALNNDIERNLRAPLAGIRAVAARVGQPLPALRVAVRTGDTPAPVRAQMLKNPPHILITTPESLYLLLTSPRARDMFRGTRTVIVDEIHTLCGDKRGAHLAISLERLERLAGVRVQRIGLSATIRPLAEVARFLGGQEPEDGRLGPGRLVDGSLDPQSADLLSNQSTNIPTYRPRPVTIIDTGYHKPLDLQVITPVDDFHDLPGNSIWPAVIPRVLGDVMRHRSTLIFCNNRRLAERTADRLNAQIAAEQSEEVPPGSTEVLAPGGVMRDRGMFAIGAEGPIRAHHASMSREARQRMEEDLKAGRLPALVGTSSLELGIDIGAVDLVVQLQSPKSVAQGLQRVGRSGHLVGQTSRGRIYATFREDLVEAAAVARGMLEGDVEPTFAPQNPLDVLAQQVVAMVSVEDWPAPALYDLVRQAYPYRELPEDSFRSVLAMLAGGFYEAGGPVHSSLRAKISWDRTNDRLAALPGTRLLALSNAGTIPDTGAFNVYLADGVTKVGTLDEEFIFETRVGDVFLLGSNTWRVLKMEDDHIVVGEAAGSVPRMPFWRGDYPWRPYELGVRIGRLRREVAERLRQIQGEPGGAYSSTPTVAGGKPPAMMAAGDAEAPRAELIGWLRREFALDESSARNLVNHVAQQLDAVGVIATDTTVVVESFADAIGSGRVVVHSPFGGRVNGAWALALSHAFRERLGVGVETQVNDDGILLRVPAAEGFEPADLVRAIGPSDARERILRELPDSALFGAHFRMNAARSLLLPKAHGRRRTPFWLQRLKARDLLAIARQYDDFPIVAETYRDCLRDALDLPHLEQLLAGIGDGSIRVVPVETIVPSPVAAGLLFNFISVYMYEWDAPKAERQLGELALRRELLDDLWPAGEKPRAVLAELLKPEAIAEAVARAQHLAPDYGARSAEELSVVLRELGDLTTEEVIARCTTRSAAGARTDGSGPTAVEAGTAWLAQLAEAERILELAIPTARGPETRWVPADLRDEYHNAFRSDHFSRSAPPGAAKAATTYPRESSGPAEAVLRRYLRAAGPVTRAEILDRYAFDESWLDAALDQLVASREIARGGFTPPLHGSTSLPVYQSTDLPISSSTSPPDQYCSRQLLEQMHRHTLAILRREVQPVSPAAHAEFLLRWQGLARPVRTADQAGLQQVMAQLRGVALPWPAWAEDVLPARLPGYEMGDLVELFESNPWVWAAAGRDPRRARVRFFLRGEGALFLPPPDDSDLGEDAGAVYGFLEAEGASFYDDLASGLSMKSAVLRAALAELTLAGLTTNDTLDGLLAVLSFREESATERKPLSSLEADLAARRPVLPVTRVLSRQRYHSAKHAVARRLRAEQPRALRPGEDGFLAGRWSLLHRAGVSGPPRTDEARAEAQARVLLARYGVLTRELMEREEAIAEWGALAGSLARFELRGEVRRGYFVAGLSGLQYALPEAVEQLRAAAGATEAAGTPLVVLNATDPANIFGGEAQGTGQVSGEALPRFARLPSTHLVIAVGKPLLIAEDGGQRMTRVADVPQELLQRAVRAYLERPSAPRRVVVTLWNGEPALDGPAQDILRPLGFTRTPSGLEWWANS